MTLFTKVASLLCIISLGFATTNPPEIDVIQEQGSRMVVVFELNGYDIESVNINDRLCSRITLPGQVTFLEKGLPELPTIARNLIIPDDALMDYRILDVEYETQRVLPIVPSKGNLYRDTDPDDVPYTFSTFYGTDAWWPENVIELNEPFILRDYRGISVRFNPFQYNPAHNELKIAKRVVVELYEKGKGGANTIEQAKSTITREFANIYERIFLNFTESRYDSLSERAGRMVIITADAYLSNLDDFKEWKRMKGIETKVVPISSIGNNETAIKNFIQSEYDAGDLVWVLLVGDGNEVVPATGTNGAAYGDDADPVYAYTAGGDYYPDLFISRFSSRSGNSVNIDKQVSRSIEYEKNPQAGADWYHVGLGVASAQYGSTPYADSTRMNWLRDSLLAFTYTEVNKSYDYWGTSALIKSYIEAGTSIINYIGHGSTTGWGNGGGFYISNINSLDNPWMLPFVISVACLVGNFNGLDCYCEASVTAGTVNQPDGFLVHWGSTINQSWVPPCVGQEGAVNLLTHGQKNTFGGICFNGACYMIEAYGGGAAGVEMAQTWHIFGDASIQVRTDKPQNMSVSHDPSINTGQTTFHVNVPGVQSALVGLYIDTLLVGHGYTDGSGVTITLDPPPSAAGTMYITVTAFNKIPYLGSVPIVEGESVPPAAPLVCQVDKRDRSVEITWNAVTTDTMGQPENMDCYIVYRNTTPDFVPNGPDSIGMCNHPDTVYMDDNALDDGLSYYYLIKAVDQAYNQSKKSNMAYAFHKFFNENPDATDKNWVALPCITDYATVADLVADLSPAGDPLTVITRLDDTLQQYESYLWLGSLWSGPDFAIEPGCAYEMVTTADTSLVFVGTNDPDGLISLNENPAKTDRNWVAMPYNAVYSTVSDITTEYAPAGNPLTVITRLDDTLQQYESYLWLGSMWAGPDFAIVPGTGYEFVTVADTFWNPTEHDNEPTRGYEDEASPLTASSQSGIDIVTGRATQPDREPAWTMRGDIYVPASTSLHNGTSYREVGRSHIVRAHLQLPQCDKCTFTAYRQNKPYDALTENMIGSGAVMNDERIGLWFDIGNFRIPWTAEDEIILIVEASAQGNDYYGISCFAPDVGANIQEITTITLEFMPEPVFANGAVTWQSTANEHVIGYSIYHGEERLNDAIITQGSFAAEENVEIRPIVKGGYEIKTVTHGAQGEVVTRTPLSPALLVSPVPFKKNMTVSYQVPQSGWVGISVYDAAGRLVQTLVSETCAAGYYAVPWDGADAAGRAVPAGVYFVKFKTDTYQAVEKTILLR